LLGFRINVELTEHALDPAIAEKIDIKHQTLNFEILLGEKFPFVFPMLFCKTTVTRSLLGWCSLMMDVM
jgi:hypothetical protein